MSSDNVHVREIDNMSEARDTLGTRLIALRKEKGWNQTDLAKICGVAKSSQVNYERHGRMPDAEYLCRLSLEEEVDIQYIITGVKSKPIRHVINDDKEFDIGDISSEDYITAMLKVLDAVDYLDLKFRKKQVLILTDYAVENNSTHEELVAWIETTFALAGMDIPAKT